MKYGNESYIIYSNILVDHNMVHFLDEHSAYLSIRDARIVVVIAEGWASFSLKTLSTTEISVEVVSMPQKAHQSLTTKPAPITSEPLFTVPA